MSDDIAGVGIRVETDGITGGIKALDALADQGPKVEKSLQGVEASAAKTGKSIASLGQGGAEAGLARVAKSGGEAATGISKVGGASTMAAAAAKKASEEAVASIDTIGMSAKQTAAALRGVPAQFTDIITSLQAGQAPLQVFLQQGGQLKDQFGGAGAAARALGGYVLGLVNPFTLAAAAAGAVAVGYFKGAQEAQEFNKALVLTGNQAGLSVGSLTAMAERLDGLGTTQGKATDALLAFVRAGRVGAEEIQRFSLAAINLEKVGGPAVEQTAKAFAELGKDPLQASLKLNDATGFLTKSVYEQIKALTDQGKTVEAAQVAQAAYAASVEDGVPKIVAQLGYVEQAWKGIVDFAKEAADAIKSVGRVDNTLQAAITRTQRQLDDANAVGDASAANEAQRLLERLQQSLKLEQDVGKAKAEQSRQAQAKADFDRAGERFLSDQLKLEREIAQARELGRIAGESDAKIQERVAAIRAAASKSTDNAAQREREQQLEREASLIEKSIGLSGNYYKSLEDLNKARQRGALVGQAYVDAVNHLTAAQPFAVKSAKDLADSLKGVADAEAAGIKLREQYIDGLLKGGDAAAKQVQQLRDEEAAAAIAATGNISLAQAIQQVAIARLQEQQAAVGADTEAAAAIEREIAKRRELITLMGSADARKAAADAAKDAEREWVRASDRIEDSITNALMRGFESGKGFAENFRDTLVNIFKTEVLRPFIGQLTRGLFGFGGLAGGLSLPGVANAATGASSASSLLSLAGLSGQAGSIGQAIAAGFMSTIGGGTLAGGQAAGLLAGGAGTGTGFAGMLGAALPWVGGAALIGNALGLFRSTKTVGSGITGDLGGTVQDFEVRRKGGSLFSGPSYSTPTIGVSNLNSDLQATFAALRNTAAGFASTLGLDAEAARRFTTPIGSEKLSDDTGGIGIRLEGLSADEVAKKIEAELTAANERLARAVLGTAADAFTKTGETASQTLERLAGSLVGVNGVLTALGQAALQVSTQGGAYASALLEQFGGLQQYQASAGQFLTDFYSEAERTALATRGLEQQLASLGLSVPATRDAYRQLVEAQDLSTEAGQKAYAALLQLAPGFAQLVPAIQSVADVVDETALRMAEAGRRALEDLARDGGSLRVDLLRAQGDEPAARALEREQALAAVRGNVTEADLAAITAAYDLNQAYRDQIDAASAATEAQRAIEAAQKSAAESLKRTLDDLSGTRLDLEGELLTAQGREAEAQALARQRELEKLTGGLGAEDAARVVAAFDLNAALRQQIAETNAANQAAQALADAQSRAAEDATRAAEQFRDAWKGITDTLFDEVARIRGAFGASGGDSLASLQSRFAITTAQARAGDQEAAKLLPGLSQTLLQLAEEGAASLIDLQRIRAQVAGSLEQTGLGLAGRFGLNVPQFEVGTNYVPKDMLAVIHQGEAIVPRAYNPAAGGSEAGSAQVVAELRALKAELAIMKAQLAAGNSNTARVASAVEGNQTTPILVEIAP